MTIQLTDAQRADFAAKIANNPGSRVTMDFTPEQEAAWRQAAAEEDARKGERQEHQRALNAAAKQPGFFGDLRRALAAHGRQMEIAERIGVSFQELDDFCLGQAALPPAAIDALVSTLGLRLMQEIPDRPEPAGATR
ncbi:MAG: hypothetical protein KF861_22955 [Planctomycetaceae bacterium]|nr:hypothetical protein [Planctomycetaceae bacterium]